MASNRLYFISTASDATSEARAYDFSGIRQPDDDIPLGAGFWQGGLASDTYIYFVSNGTNVAAAYDFDGNRQTDQDISLDARSWQGDVSNLWTLRTDANWIDIGVPERLAYARRHFQKGVFR